MFTLPELPYAYNALEVAIDEETMKLHHDKHHAAYVKNLNDALVSFPDLSTKSIEELLGNLSQIPEDVRTKVRNNGGGHYNHTHFWEVMTPGGAKEPTGALLEAINQNCGDFITFKDHFSAKALSRFGSGWVWLIKEANGSVQIVDTPNQDNPIMEGKAFILGLDVWEHAYYLKYQNRRADYVSAWWNVINWDVVSKLYGAS